MGYDRNDRRYGRDQSYGYRPQGPARDYERGYDRGEDLSYNRDRGYGSGGYARGRTDYGRPPQGYDQDDRGFFDRAGDEVRSWFGDEEAERRRRYDERYADREPERDRSGTGRDSYRRDTSDRLFAAGIADAGLGMPSAGYGWNFRDDQRPDRDRGSRGRDHDPSYSSWRDRQIEALDRDYDDYRREHQSKFDNEFTGWRSRRQGQRDSLGQVQEHQEVVGSDGQHVGKVDHVRGDRILLAKNDQNAGGHHHSIPSSWITKVGDKVEIDRTAAEAQKAWKDEESNKAIGGNDDRSGGRNLNRSFSGTY
ncbi:DUF2171 domain-containing protein [Sphingomonas solaris]|uniref:DUF2171 domain-containing protein n=1 Tax=Alterirhizorhabdus solaris TaxID=2529389 RepID=A0A558QZP3_9SPHN|nr:DUF2171 domain-containing protein [Sphingomonas solaris]TVV72557.1 DUF2171 domain-containing protein [Sphingomonas solaris]